MGFPDLSSPEKGSVFGPSWKEQQGQCDGNSMSRQENGKRPGSSGQTTQGLVVHDKDFIFIFVKWETVGEFGTEA